MAPFKVFLFTSVVMDGQASLSIAVLIMNIKFLATEMNFFSSAAS